VSKLLERLRDAKRSGVYRAGSARPIEEATQASGLDVVAIDAYAGELLPSIARALQFPSWFGANWDALQDLLGDLSWRTGEGHVLLFHRAAAGEAVNMLIDVLHSSAEYWASRGKPFFAVFIDPEKELELPDLYRGA
jgi:hypothetical protein